jgi:hypothetical protein
MRKIVLGALLGFLAACGSKSNTSHPDTIVVIPDAPAPGVCNPIMQSGCDTGQKCTWVRVAASTSSQIGQLGCVPDGTVDVNGACTYGAAGAQTGYDTCKKGLICLASSRTDMAAGTCATICDTTAAAGATGACATNYACGLYYHYFENTGDPAQTVGLCDPTCHPLTQKRDYDSTSASGDHCGAPLDAGGNPTKACNGLPAGAGVASHFTCSSVLDPTKKSDAIAYDASIGGVALNACAAGYIPLLYDNSTDAAAQDQMKVICVAFCQPAETDSANKAMAGGATPYTCAAAGAAAPHECRYWWFLEGDTSGAATMSEFSNGLGYCFNYTNYSFDGSKLHPPQANPTGQPSCTTQSSTAKTWDAGTGGAQTIPDNLYWGCAPEPTMFTGGKNTRIQHAPSVFRPLLSAEQLKTAD